MPDRRAVALGACLTTLGLAGAVAACHDPPHAPEAPAERARQELLLGPGGVEVTGLAASTDDSTLFATTVDGRLWRAPAGSAALEWEQVAQIGQEPGGFWGWVPMYAASARTVFILTQSHTLRWDEGRGLRAEPNPLADSSVYCGDLRTGPALRALWGRDERDVYAVGDHGEILHYDGATWSLEPNALNERARNLCDQAGVSALWAVGGDDRTVYAAGGSVLRRTPAGGWVLEPHPTGVRAESGYIGAVAPEHGGSYLFAGVAFASGFDNPDRFRSSGPALYRRSPTGAWQDLSPGLTAQPRPYMPLFLGGGGPDLAVFWTYQGDVIIAREGRIEEYTITALPEFGAGVAVGGSVYLAGSADDGSYIVRLRW